MMSVKALKGPSEAGQYYSKADYYTKGEDGVDIHSSWYGEGAELLGLEGPVNQKLFEKMLEGKLPNDVLLGTMRNGEWKHAPGWDFTLSAPKSVSILALVGGDNRLMEAHQEAARNTLDYMQEHLIKSQTNTAQGRDYVDTPNAIFAQFTHTTSREHDPQLHTHNVLVNAAATDDGQWRSVYSRLIYNHSKLLGMIYQSELGELVKELGYTPVWNTEHGTFELEELSREELLVFSERRQQIQEYAEEHGLKTPKELDDAATRTRQAKQDRPTHEILDEWDKRAAEHGLDLEYIIDHSKGKESKARPDQSSTGKSNENTSTGKGSGAREYDEKNGFGLMPYDARHMPFETAYEALMVARNVLAHHEQVFTNQALLETALKVSQGRYNIRELLVAKDKMVSDGNLIVSAKESEHYTTANAIKTELNILDHVVNGREKYEPFATEKQVDDIKFQMSFTQGQDKSFGSVLGTRDKFYGLQGFAGVGKTYMMTPVVGLAKENGYVVRGMAPNGEQAEVLSKETGVEAQTVKSFLMDLESEKHKPGGKELWIVDEAGLLNAKDMETLVKHASDNRGVRVLFSGDKAQLGSIEAGRIFATMMKGGMGFTVNNDIIRQKDEKLLSAVQEFTKRDVKAAFDQLDPFMHQYKTEDARFAAFTREFMQRFEDTGKMPMAIIPNNEGRERFHDLLRGELKERGVIGKEDTQLHAFKPGKVDGTMKRYAYFYEKGMVVRFNTRLAGVNASKGEYFRVVDIKGDNLVLENYHHEGGINKQFEINPSTLKFKDFDITNYTVRDLKVAVGDKIVWKDKSKDLGLINGSQGVITSVKGTVMTVDFGERGVHVIDASKDNQRHFEHAYSSTTYNAQGKTDDHNLVMAESWRRNLVTQPAMYVNVSRGKFGVSIYTDDKEKLSQRVEERFGEKTASLEHVTKMQAEQIRQPPEHQKGLMELLGIRKSEQMPVHDHNDSFYTPINTFHENPEEKKRAHEHEFQRRQQHERSK